MTVSAALMAGGCTDPGTGGGPTTPPVVGTVTRIAGGGQISSAVISRNGRWIAFVSTAPTPGTDGNGAATDVFVYDRQTSATSRVTGGDGASDSPSVADDGSVVFRSAATNLAGPDLNGRQDAFRWTAGGGVQRITDSTADVIGPLVSADGSTVVVSGPSSLTTPGGGARLEAYRWQPAAPALARLAPVGTEGSSAAAVSDDGSRVLLAEPGRLSLWETATGSSTLVASATPSPAPPRATTFSVAPHSIAGDGDVVFSEVTYSFESVGGLLTFEAGTAMTWDRQTATVSAIPAAGLAAGPVQSSAGRHVITADVTGVSVDQDQSTTFLPGAIRSFDRTTGVVVTVAAAAQAAFTSVSADGRFVAFVSTDPVLVTPDPNGADADVYLWDRGP